MSAWFVPLVVGGVFLFALVKKVDVFDAFVEGAKEGLEIAVCLLPVLVGLLSIVGMLSASGCIDCLCAFLSPVFEQVGLSQELIPLALLRPISGSGSLTLLEQVFQTVSPDSPTGLTASLLVCCSETTFYTLAVYFGAVRVKKTGYALPCALLGDFTAMVMSVWSVRLLCG